jgi:phosphoacetylglucosamine mutase
LNYDCGAEFLHKEIQFPTNFVVSSSPAKAAAFDGDADRLIYFTKAEGSKPIIIDGDKQFALIGKYITELLNEVGVEVPMIMVNTAYSNG